MATGILRIQAFAARQSSPVEGVTVTVSGNGFTATRLTDAEGNADDVTLTTPPDVKIGTTIFSKKQKKISRIKFPIGLNPLESPMRLIRTYFNY